MPLFGIEASSALAALVSVSGGGSFWDLFLCSLVHELLLLRPFPLVSVWAV